MHNKRWRVLVVEDEFRIGQLIKKLIKWDEIGLECINVVDNGETAFKVIEEELPDIVITDIRMPKINGLDLIRMTKERYETIKFVVISGYKEFEYAHRALQYEVNDYLLKPVNEEEINKVLRKIHAEITKDTLKLKEEENLKKTVTVSEQIIKSKILNNIIDQVNAPSMDEVKEDYNLELNASAYRGIDIKLDILDYEKSDKRQDRITVDKIITIVEKKFKNEVKEQLICEKENLHIYCLINYDKSKAKLINNVINNILSEIQEYLLGFEQYEATIGIGSEEAEFGRIRFSIQEAYRSVQNRIKVGTGRLIYAEMLHLDHTLDLEDFLRKEKETFIKSIDTYSKKTLDQSINQIFGDILFQERIDYSCFYDIAHELIHIFFDNIALKNKEGDKIRSFLLNVCQQCNTVTKLKDLLKRYLGEYLEVSLRQLETDTTKPIRQAKQYIDEHFKEKIVLEDIAQIVDLNPVYFSVLFKKETGLNFSAYLANVRMEMAKKMIRNTNETIAAIADAVGYKDTRHFSQIFTKTVGIKPALYRRLHS